MSRKFKLDNLLLIQTAIGGGGLSWLLRDEFTDTRAAGSVGGTPAAPGPGTRTVADTDSKVFISGGALNLAAHSTPVWGDPGLWYDSIERIAGRVLVVQIQFSTTNQAIEVGFDVNQNGEIVSSGGVRSAASGILRWVQIGADLNVGSYAHTTAYTIALVVRASGMYLFLTGGAFLNWMLIWLDDRGNQTPLYPAVSNNQAITTHSFIRIPDGLYLPTPLAYDTFTRASGVLGSSEQQGPDGQTATARTWNNRVGTTLVAGNAARASALVGGLAIATVDTGTVDTIVQATLTRAGDEVGVILRYADADNYVRAVHDGTNCQLIKRVATVETTVITAAVAIGAGAIVVICEGTSFSLYLNNAKVGSTSTISDAGLQTGTEQGLYSTNTGNTQDAFLMMPRGTSGEYNALNRWST